MTRTTALRAGVLAGIAVLALAAWYSFSAREPGETVSATGSETAGAAAVYIGSRSCAQCHATESQSRQASQHAVAMQLANERTVLGNFDDATQLDSGKRQDAQATARRLVAAYTADPQVRVLAAQVLGGQSP